MQKKPKLKFQILLCLLLVTLSALLGFANSKRLKKDYLRIPAISKDDKLAEIKKKLPIDIQVITTEETKKIFDENSSLFVDARATKEYEAGHIESAISCPENEIEKWIPEFLQKYPSPTPLVIYCSGAECNASLNVALKLKENGYTNIKLYAEGYSTWVIHPLQSK